MGYRYAALDELVAQDMNDLWFCTHSERNPGQVALGAPMALGNGATNGAFVVPVNCRLVYATLYMAGAAVGTTTLTLYVNGVATAHSISIVNSGSTILDLSVSPVVTLSAGDDFNWIFTSVPSPTDQPNVCSFFRQV